MPGGMPVPGQPAQQAISGASGLASQQASGGGSSVTVQLQILTSSANAQLLLDRLMRASSSNELQTALSSQGTQPMRASFLIACPMHLPSLSALLSRWAPKEWMRKIFRKFT